MPTLRDTRALLVVALLLALCGCAQERRDPPLAQDGVIDLSDWNFETDGIVDLGGEWRFVWEEFVEPMPSEPILETRQDDLRLPDASGDGETDGIGAA